MDAKRPKLKRGKLENFLIHWIYFFNWTPSQFKFPELIFSSSTLLPGKIVAFTQKKNSLNVFKESFLKFFLKTSEALRTWKFSSSGLFWYSRSKLSNYDRILLFSFHFHFFFHKNDQFSEPIMQKISEWNSVKNWKNNLHFHESSQFDH